MYCRKCMKEGKKVNMLVQVEDKCYICQECGYIVNWTQEGKELKNEA